MLQPLLQETIMFQPTNQPTNKTKSLMSATPTCLLLTLIVCGVLLGIIFQNHWLHTESMQEHLILYQQHFGEHFEKEAENEDGAGSVKCPSEVGRLTPSQHLAPVFYQRHCQAPYVNLIEVVSSFSVSALQLYH